MDDITFKAPKDIADTVEREAKRAGEKIVSKKLRWSEQRMGDIASDISKKYEIWKRQTMPLRRKLVRWNEMLEGVVQDTNFPFEGASNLTLHYAAGVASSFKATVNRTLYGDPDIFLLRGEAGMDSKELDDLQDAQNHTFHTESNGLDTMKLGTIPCFRDGTLIISGTWKTNIELGNDQRIYTTAVDFANDYPDAESAGITEEAYQNVMDQFLVQADHRQRVGFQYKFVQFDGPEYEIIPLARFVLYPTYAQSIARAEMYGKEYEVSDQEIRSRGQSHEFYSKAVEIVLARANGMTIDEFAQSKNFIDGIMPNTDEKKPIKLVDLVYKCETGEDGVLGKYLVTFAPEAKVILSIEPYPLRRNLDFCVDFRFQARENRFIGVSLMGDTEDLFLFMDTIHNHRNNIRMLVTAPILLANKNQKEEIDLQRSESLIRPGVTFWVTDVEKAPVKQLVLQNLDQPGNSQDEENIIVRYIELRTGTTQGLSGRENPSDPRAPMGKYLAQLNQANMRVDDFIDEFRKGFSALGELNCSLYYQYGPDSVKWMVDKNGKPEQKEVNRNLFAAPGVKWYMRKRSTVFSPEMAMQRIGGLMQIYMQLFSLLQQQDSKAVEIWNRMVLASGEPDNEKFLIQPMDPMMQQKMQMMQQLLANAPQANGKQKGQPQAQAAPQPGQPAMAGGQGA